MNYCNVWGVILGFRLGATDWYGVQNSLNSLGLLPRYFFVNIPLFTTFFSPGILLTLHFRCFIFFRIKTETTGHTVSVLVVKRHTDSRYSVSKVSQRKVVVVLLTLT